MTLVTARDWRGENFLAWELNRYLTEDFLERTRQFESLLFQHSLIRKAYEIAYQVHWGDERRFEGVPFFYHVLGVAFDYAEGFPDAAPSIATAILHDSIENARKYVVYLKDLTETKISDYEAFFEAHVTPLFLEFVEQNRKKKLERNQTGLSDLISLVNDKNTPNSFTRFIARKIDSTCGKYVARIVRLLTRETNEKIYNFAFINEDIPADLRRTAADIKTRDAKRNLLSVDIGRNPEHASKTVLRLKDNLLFLREAGARKEWTDEMEMLLKKTETALCEKDDSKIIFERIRAEREKALLLEYRRMDYLSYRLVGKIATFRSWLLSGRDPA